MITLPRFPRFTSVAALIVCTTSACSRGGGCRDEYCGTLVFAGVGEATSLLPPVSDASVDRDIYDQVFLRLADLTPDGGTIGDSGFVPQLAQRWEWTDPLTLVFHLDPRARWQDGPPVTAEDVAFTFAAYTDTAVDAADRGTLLAHIASVTAQDSLTAVFHFRDRYPEMFYDAVFHMRILPAHQLRNVPTGTWRTAEFGRKPVGAGPYRFVRWTPGQSLELAADSGFFLGRPHLRRLVWRFAGDLNVAITQVVAGEADAVEVLLSPTNIERARNSGHLTLYPYAGPTYTFLRFNLRASGDSLRPHPIFADRDVRRALVLATDRERMCQSVFSGNAKVPPGPMPQSWAWLWVPQLTVPAYDTAQAARLLAARGWRDSDNDGVRDRGGRKLSFHLSVPSTSPPRIQYAQLLQEALKSVGVEVVIDQMESTTLQERLRASGFDAALESWFADPTPSSAAPGIWGTHGASNFGHYISPAFDRQVATAASAATPDAARTSWIAAFGTLEQDAPGIMLYSVDNIAAIDSRVTDVQIRPDSWWALVRTWRIPPDKLNERDRVGG
jgi:peptide/nickel transport system substrate-binding protein